MFAGLVVDVIAAAVRAAQEVQGSNILQISRKPVAIKDTDFPAAGPDLVRCLNNLCTNHNEGFCKLNTGKCDLVKVQK